MDRHNFISFISNLLYVLPHFLLENPGMVRVSNPCGGEIFRALSDWPRRPTSLLYDAYRVSLPGVKRLERGVDQQPPPRAEVKERVELYIYSPSGPS